MIIMIISIVSILRMLKVLVGLCCVIEKLKCTRPLLRGQEIPFPAVRREWSVQETPGDWSFQR